MPCQRRVLSVLAVRNMCVKYSSRYITNSVVKLVQELIWYGLIINTELSICIGRFVHIEISSGTDLSLYSKSNKG